MLASQIGDASRSNQEEVEDFISTSAGRNEILHFFLIWLSAIYVDAIIAVNLAFLPVKLV